MRLFRATLAAGILVALCLSAPVSAQACFATSTSLTPPSWRVPTRAPQAAPMPGLALVHEVPLPGPPNRFDYQSFDPVTHRIYMNHMNAGRTVVFDTDSDRVVT